MGAEGVTGHAQHDFIIVGSGAGGGPLAANLVEAGFSVTPQGLRLRG